MITSFPKNKVLFSLLVFVLLLSSPIRCVYAAAIDSTFTIANTNNREMALGLAFDGTNFLVGMQGDGDAPDSVVAQLVSPFGTLIGSLITTEHFGGVPIIEFDGSNYLMVWQDCGEPYNEDLFGMLVSPAGSVVAPAFKISDPVQGGDGLAAGGLASDGSNYLVVYFKEVNPSEGDSKVYGRLVSTNGGVGVEIAISTGFGDFGLNNVAFDGTNYLVVWVDDTSDTEIRGRFVSPTGVLGTEFSINANSYHSDNIVSVIFDGTNYLVVWEDQVGGWPDGEWDLFAQRLDTFGGAVGDVIPVSTAAGSQHMPSVAFDGSRFLVTWTDLRNQLDDNFICNVGDGTCMDIYGQFLSQSGSLLGPELRINEDPGNQFAASVAFGASKYMVVWTSGDVFGGVNGDVFGTTISSVAQNNEVWVPVSASSPGVGVSYWTTNACLFNPGDIPLEFTATFLPIGQDNTNSSATDVQSLLSKELLCYDDFIVDAYGQEGGAGASMVITDATIFFGSRISTPSNDVADGTYGQYVPGFSPVELFAAGETAFLPDARENDAFRSNLGLLNLTLSVNKIDITVYKGGDTVAETVRYLSPRELIQINRILDKLGLSGDGYYLTVTGTGALSTYLSVIDNETDDPTFITGMKPLGSTSIIPVTAFTAGAENTQWKTQLALVNTTDESLAVTVIYGEINHTLSGTVSQNITVPAQSMWSSDNFLSEVFSLANGASGWLKFEGMDGMVASSRTYNLSDMGTFGQSIFSVDERFALNAGEKAYLFMGRQNEIFRFNVGFLNASETATTVRVIARNADGSIIGTHEYQIGSWTLVQKNRFIKDFAAEVDLVTLEFEITDGNEGPLYVYGSLVDNLTGDPSFMMAS